MRARRLSVSLFLLFVLVLATPFAVSASEFVMNQFGFVYEDGGFPTSNSGDALTGLGLVTSGPMSCDLVTEELTWVIKDLISEGQTSPDGGRTLIISYTGGSIALYCDPSQNHDWGTYPPNGTAPTTFEDGTEFLVGTFSQFVMFYDTLYNIGSFQGIINFTGGSYLGDLTNAAGLIFAGTLGPQLDPNLPDGYDLQAVGRIIAPHRCNLAGDVQYYDPSTGETGPVENVAIDLVDSERSIFSTAAAADGSFGFTNVAGETLQVSIDVPLGYRPDGDTAVLRICQADGTAYVYFRLIRVETQGVARSKGFWKHQVNSALRGKTNGTHHDGAELLAFMGIIHDRFDPYFDLYVDVTVLDDMRRVLEQKPQFTKKATQFDKARAQFLALLLNLVSNRLATWQVVSDDGATLSQAITYIGDLLTDTDEPNDLLAKIIAEDIVHGVMVGAGVIPLSIPQIAYLQPGDDFGGRDKKDPGISVSAPSGVRSFAVYPNPFNPSTTISYDLGVEAQVTLAIYNVRGQVVRELVSGKTQRGLTKVLWDGKDNFGREVASGVYFSHLRIGQKMFTQRMVLIR